MKAVVEIVSLALIFSLESFFPLFTERTGRIRHATRNLGLGILNVVVVSLFFSSLLALDAAWTRDRNVGLVYLTGASSWTATLLAFVLLDLWMYLFHRANHQVPFLWRFHRTHHSDSQVDVTTALRFHTGEIAISSLFKLALIPLLGVSLGQLLLYETCLQPVILLHHSNVAIPEKWDRWMRLVIVSPNMHRVHHSQLRPETDSNYSSIFSFWDRIARSFRRRPDPKSLEYGLPEFPGAEWQTFPGMLKTPLAPLRLPGRG